MICTVLTANMGQQECLVEIRSAYSPGMSKILGLNSCFCELISFGEFPIFHQEALWCWLAN